MPAIVSLKPDHGTINALAIHKGRLIDHSTGEFLHLSGQGRTTSTHYAWLGTQRQAENLAHLAQLRGEDWPFSLIHRKHVDTDKRPPRSPVSAGVEEI